MCKNKIISEWFELYGDDIYNYVVYRVGSMDVDDIVQEVFMKALQKYETFRKESNPKTWLISIARNKAIDEMRKRGTKWRKNMMPFHQKCEIPDHQTPEKVLQMNEEHRELYQAIQSLKTNYREVILLRGIEGFSIKDTASILGWSESKVRSTYYRACKAIKNQLRGHMDE
ncbi:RNA polymerase sigma-70 factor (ECF subfamily) [Melghiribacillus thermohalophilus]|uniref:RNA polymerase sigma factor n=1 Tax=Melghiribacillus thermohalophilus TaxID=1324956 RepID=A0A4R3MXM4_9BACI|nr:RNA polymerase sigma factor [Melghiribacillus thermohalophilus]TCT21124.1 RNA polymerase sigma-70 factor (ECF subfamily) [Melghiribacillus thermohalophilus]